MSSRDEIAKLLFDNHYHEMPKTRYYDMQDAEDEADQILAILAPIIEKARMYDTQILLLMPPLVKKEDNDEH